MVFIDFGTLFGKSHPHRAYKGDTYIIEMRKNWIYLTKSLPAIYSTRVFFT